MDLAFGGAYECSQQTGMHICEDHFLPEIIDPDTGEVLPEGTPGELVFHGDEVVGGGLAGLEQHRLDLGGEYVDAADDEHVVGAAPGLGHLDEGTAAAALLPGEGGDVPAVAIPVSSGNTKRQVQILQDFESDILCCTPSYATYIGETLRDMGVKPEEIKLSAGILGAEPSPG